MSAITEKQYSRAVGGQICINERDELHSEEQGLFEIIGAMTDDEFREAVSLSYRALCEKYHIPVENLPHLEPLPHL